MNFGGGPATTPPTPYTPGGQQGCFFGEPGDGSHGGAGAPAEQQFKWPSGHVRLADGNTLVAETRSGAIREVSPDQKTPRLVQSPAMKHPAAFVVVEE